jgi:hypothetical protein
MAADPHLNHIPTMKVRAWEDDAGIPFGKFFPPDVTCQSRAVGQGHGRMVISFTIPHRSTDRWRALRRGRACRGGRRGHYRIQAEKKFRRGIKPACGLVLPVGRRLRGCPRLGSEPQAAEGGCGPSSYRPALSSRPDRSRPKSPPSRGPRCRSRGRRSRKTC